MAIPTKTSMQYQLLAAFRYEIRKFLSFSEQAALRAGIEPQQHQALLVVKGLPANQVATIRVLSERLQIAHHSAVELVDRLAAKKLIYRSRSTSDRRAVVLKLTPRGEKLLRDVTVPHVAELRAEGRKLLRTLSSVLNHKERCNNRKNETKVLRHGIKRGPVQKKRAQS